MKKLLIIMTLFMSSFFFICNKEVKAHEYTKEVDFSIMDDVLSLKEKLDAFVETDTTFSDYYLIYYNIDYLVYYVFPLDSVTPSFSYEAGSTYFYVKYASTIKSGSNKDIISLNSSNSSATLYMYLSSGSFVNNIIVYSNFNISYKNTIHTFTYNYQDFSYTENTGKDERLTTLYDVYLIYQEYLGIEQENPHQEEIDKVTNFYTMVIEKISYLANEISNNYILLFVIGIFIITFVFLLIFRRFL